MKFVSRILLLLLIALAATVAYAQIQYKAPPHFNHIVIIVQENRTPDNLFGAAPGFSGCGGEDPFEAGVDITDGGTNKAAGGAETCMTPVWTLNEGGANHSHKSRRSGYPVGWETQCDQVNGKCQMDGACAPDEYQNHYCPEYTYVKQSVVQPYFDIATNYGWANYMFQTNQGPSFVAHQFIFSGTSAPVWPGDTYFQDFVAENPTIAQTTSGCPGDPLTNFPKWIDPGENELVDQILSECYDRNTLVTYQDSNGVHDKLAEQQIQAGWKYYVQKAGFIWDAPESNPQICYSASSGSGPCNENGAEWKNHVSLPTSKTSAPVLSDILNCQLPAISWVTPDEAWSDHPSQNAHSLGPSWVADIVDAIGNSVNSGCDYWKADPTVIFITWDDWGGFYDHVPPPVLYKGHQDSSNQWVCGKGDAPPNGWGCGYVYGFRVPLLVVSEYTQAGTISGPTTGTGTPNYPPAPEWTHDFGSILAFTEKNFSLGPIAPQTPIQYTYADQNSLDAKLPNGQQVVPLWDFFLPGSTRAFTQIAPTNPAQDANYFINYYLKQQPDGSYLTPIGPDGGDDD